MRSWRRVPLIVVVGLVVAGPAGAFTPTLHEQIPNDPRDDVALSVSLDGDLPAALDTPSGLVTAPDPRRPPTPGDPRAQPGLPEAPPNAQFRPDRDTRRPDVLPYEDPFTPSTAPFKRLVAFDTVDASYTLSVHDPRMQTLPAHGQPAADGSDEQFYGDLVVELVPGRQVRIPSVGPGAKVVRARAGVGTSDVPFRLFHDGADNWFIEGQTATRARLVMELTIPRAAFGGEMGDPGWSDLRAPPALPANVARAANQVAARIGVSRALSPREAVGKLVAYFRAFVDTEDPLPSSGDIYLDLALSKKGVCRHRAFAFLVTAIALGIPTRMVTNEAHAWVEVNDGSLWRRIDLGGAGRALREPLAEGVHHEPPPDPFAWPPNASRGDDLADRSRSGAPSPGGGGAGPGASTSNGTSSANGPNGDGADPSEATSPSPSASAEKDERPASKVIVTILDADAHRGAPLRLRGEVTADGEACGNVVVEVLLRDAKRAGHEMILGTLATDPRGAYEGALVVPQGVPLGDYDIFVRTPGDARCGRGGLK